MADDALLWTAKPPTPRQPSPGELLFAFDGGYPRRRMRCELRFHGESYGWEAQFLDTRGLFYAHGAFPMRALAIAWAQETRKDLEAMATSL